MIFKNEIKYRMYIMLSKFNTCKSFEEAHKYVCQKFNILDREFLQVVNECLERELLSGISCQKNANNDFVAQTKGHIYITYNGYEFIKNYYGSLKKFLWELFLIVATAIVTVSIDNKFSVSNQNVDISNHVLPQDVIYSKICNNSKY